MKQQTKKLLRVLLTLVMLIGLLPTAALAASEIDKVELTCKIGRASCRERVCLYV